MPSRRIRLALVVCPAAFCLVAVGTAHAQTRLFGRFGWRGAPATACPAPCEQAPAPAPAPTPAPAAAPPATTPPSTIPPTAESSAPSDAFAAESGLAIGGESFSSAAS